MNRLVIIAGFVIAFENINGQDLNFARQQVKELSSPMFYGRGYVNNGDGVAAHYLAGLYHKYHLKSFGPEFYQHYDFLVNTFPGKMDVTVDGHLLTPGIDYLVDPGSASCLGSFLFENIDSSFLRVHPDVQVLHQTDFRNKFIMLDTLGFYRYPFGNAVIHFIMNNKTNARGLVILSDKELVFSVSTYQYTLCFLHIKRTHFMQSPKVIKVNIQSKLVDHKTRNVIGFLPGDLDTFVVFTAHYDHLGLMGKNTCFPGANDNASGTSMVLDFIHSYAASTYKHKYSYAFMLFSGEEAGLLGSEYYTSNPLFPLQKIKIVLNFDMVGTGTGGVTIFNAYNHLKEFHKLDSLNRTCGLNLLLNPKGGGRNSDHYSFHEKKVPALFFLTEGKEVPYHSINDTYDRLPFTSYEKLYDLIAEYVKTF